MPNVLLTHWGRVTHICIGKLTIIGSDNGLSPGRRQAITWTNVRLLLIGPLGTNFSEMLIEIHTFSFKKIHLKVSSGKCRPFCLGLNVLTVIYFLVIRLLPNLAHFIPPQLPCHEQLFVGSNTFQFGWEQNVFLSTSNCVRKFLIEMGFRPPKSSKSRYHYLQNPFIPAQCLDNMLHNAYKSHPWKQRPSYIK